MDVVFGATGLPTGFYVATSPASTTTPIAAPSLTFSWNHAAANSTIAVNLGTLNQGNGVTCYNSPYTPSKFSIDGRPVGRLISVNINETGLVNATYDNGTTEFFAKVPIATFTNVNGLQPIYGGYSQTQQSGPYNLTFPNLGGAGPLRPGTTEDSTIDPAEIFTKMIVDQKLYTANLKGITTVEKMLDALERSIGI
jgi:flagellar hook protein FlgE